MVFSLGSVEQVLSNKHRWTAQQARTTEQTDSWEFSLTASFMLHDMRSATQTDKEKLPALLRVWKEGWGWGWGGYGEHTWLFKAASTHCVHKLANAKQYPSLFLSHIHTHKCTCSDRRKAMPFSFTGEQEKETPWCFSYLVGESEEL